MTAADPRPGYVRFTADGPLRAALENSPDCILILDLAGTVRFVNPAGARLLGAGEEAALLGAPWTALWAASDQAVAQAALEAGADGEARFTAPAPSNAGQPRRLDNVLSPLRAPAGDTVALLVVSRDVTGLEEKAHLAAAQKSALVRSAAEMARLVGLEIDFRRDRVVQEVRDVGDPEHHEDTIEHTLEMYGPEDRARIRTLLERAKLYGEPYRFDAPFNAPNGKRGWVRVFGEPIFEDGVCVGVRGAGMEITDEVAAQENLKSAEQRLRIAAELAGLEVYEFDADQRLVRGGASPSIFGGLLRADEIHLPDLIEVVDVRDRARVQEEWGEALEMRSPFRSEFRLRHGDDDRELWVYCVAETIQEGGRPRRLVAALMDITERKRTELQMIEAMAQMREHEARQKLLLDELNHRVKNTLASVQSVAAQTLTDIHALEARDLFIERLLALSSAHNLLVKHAWTSTSFQELVEVMLKPYGRPFGFEGPDLRLDPNFVVTLGMALHELSTNALKHGAWRDGGRVDVAVATEAGEARITWRESDGPPVSPPVRRGFGSRLLERGVARELGGSVVLEFAPEGLACSIRAPLSSRLLLVQRDRVALAHMAAQPR